MSKWTIIPPKKLVHYIDLNVGGGVFCDCGTFHEDLKFIPYAYDKENNDVIFAGKCKKCGKILFVKE